MLYAQIFIDLSRVVPFMLKVIPLKIILKKQAPSRQVSSAAGLGAMQALLAERSVARATLTELQQQQSTLMAGAGSSWECDGKKSTNGYVENSQTPTPTHLACDLSYFSHFSALLILGFYFVCKWFGFYITLCRKATFSKLHPKRFRLKRMWICGS